MRTRQPLYSLRNGLINGIRQRFGKIGANVGLVGALTYPIQIVEGEVWQAQLKFNHKGPAESIVVRMGPVCNGTWEAVLVTMSVAMDVDWKEYESPVIVGGTMKGLGLGDNANVGTHMEIRASDDTTVLASDDSPAGTFKYRLPTRAYDITYDKYANPSGWADYEAT